MHACMRLSRSRTAFSHCALPQPAFCHPPSSQLAPPHPYPSPKPPSAALLPAFPAATTCPVPRMLAARTTASSSRWPAPSTPPSSGPRRASRCGEARRGLGCATAPAAAAGAPMPGARRPAWSGRSSRDAPLTAWEPRGPACRTTIAPICLLLALPCRRTPFTPYRQAVAAAGAGRAQAATAAAGGPEATPGGLGLGAELPSPVELPTFV